MNEKIQKTAQFQNRVCNRLKFVFGKRVKIGKTYDGICIPQSVSDYPKGKYITLGYRDNTLLICTEDKKRFLFANGDIAIFNHLIYADHIYTCISFDVPIQELIGEAGTVTQKYQKLRSRFFKMPPSLLHMIAEFA